MKNPRIRPSKRTHISSTLFLSDDARIEQQHYPPDDDSDREVVVLRVGELTLFTSSREQAERLFDVVAEVADIWRRLDPETATIDAIVETPDERRDRLLTDIRND